MVCWLVHHFGLIDLVGPIAAIDPNQPLEGVPKESLAQANFRYNAKIGNFLVAHITEWHHYVPWGYQKGWTSERWTKFGQVGRVWAYDLFEKKVFSATPGNVLLERFFYENDPSQPTIEVEKWFNQFESQYGIAMEYLDRPFQFLEYMRKIRPNPQVEDPENRGRIVEDIYSDRKFQNNAPSGFSGLLNSLKEFAAISYARTPEIMRIKASELHNLSDAGFLAKSITTPNDLVTMFKDSSLINHFRKSNVQLWIIPDGGIVTSDRPCIDFKTELDGEYLLPGYHFMRTNNVAALMPLSSHLVAVFYSDNIVVSGRPVAHTEFSTRVFAYPQQAEYINNAVINFAGRRVISATQNGSIFNMRTVPIDSNLK